MKDISLAHMHAACGEPLSSYLTASLQREAMSLKFQQIAARACMSKGRACMPASIRMPEGALRPSARSEVQVPMDLGFGGHVQRKSLRERWRQSDDVWPCRAWDQASPSPAMTLQYFSMYVLA